MATKEKEAQALPSQKEISELVLSKVEAFTSTGDLVLPKDYSAGNALKSAMIILKETKDKNGKNALEVCTQHSIAEAMLKMIVEGLSPLKKQGYFIVYGTSLTWSRSYQGSMALAKRVGNVKTIVANVIYEDDSFEYQINVNTGYKEIVEHAQEYENIDNNKIKGAYAVIVYNDGAKDLEIMTITEIKTAWNQGASKGNSPAHKGFTQEMAKKTVINRACKTPINSSSDVNLFIGGEVEQTTQSDDVKKEIEQATAEEEVEFTEAQEVVDEPKTDDSKEDEPPY